MVVGYFRARGGNGCRGRKEKVGGLEREERRRWLDCKRIWESSNRKPGRGGEVGEALSLQSKNIFCFLYIDLIKYINFLFLKNSIIYFFLKTILPLI